MQDVLAVLDATGAERPAVYGDLEGAALSVLFAATHPERTPARPEGGQRPAGQAAAVSCSFVCGSGGTSGQSNVKVSRNTSVGVGIRVPLC